MGVNATKIFSKQITNGTFTITADMGFVVASFVLVSGLGTFTGARRIGGVLSDPIDMTVGQPITVGVNGSELLDEVEIDCQAGGVIRILAR